MSTDESPTSPATFLDLPDDVILIIASICSEGSLSIQSVPVFSEVHRRFDGVLGDDFWKQWCRRAGYAIRESRRPFTFQIYDRSVSRVLTLSYFIASHPQWNTVTYRMLADLIDRWAVSSGAAGLDPFPSREEGEMKQPSCKSIHCLWLAGIIEVAS